MFVTKYRRPVFTDEMLTFAENTVRTLCSDLDVELVEEKVHMVGFAGELAPHPPTMAISTLVQRLKGRTAYAVRHEFSGRCVRDSMRGHLWSPSYFAISCRGAPLSILKQYIDSRARPR